MPRCNTLKFISRWRESDVQSCFDDIRVHKSSAPEAPLVSFVLLDWNCRERFHTLDWLNRQTVARERYELIWVDLYERVAPEALAKADIVATCCQRGMYHKHKGYNVGTLLAKGAILVVCDSDAVFPENFVESVLTRYGLTDGRDAEALVLMYHEWRTSASYPPDLADTRTLHDRYEWWPLIPNAGACACFRREDAIRFGGFDEDASFRGYMCGPYDLAWRLVNAGIPEEWHDATQVALWHFAHPDPVASNIFLPNLASTLENLRPHADGHALTAVDAFSTGRLLPKTQNAHIWRMRMRNRRIGTEFEARYSDCLPRRGLPLHVVLCMRAYMLAWAALRIPYAHLRRIWHEKIRPVLRACKQALRSYKQACKQILRPTWHLVRDHVPYLHARHLAQLEREKSVSVLNTDYNLIAYKRKR